MVDPAGDGINRPIRYASFRTDKPATPGHSAELISDTVDPQYFDNLDKVPNDFKKGCSTFLDHFERHVRERPDESYLGYRPVQADKTFGNYEWHSYK